MKTKYNINLLSITTLFLFVFFLGNCKIFEKFDEGTNPFVKALSLLLIDRSNSTVTSVLPKDGSNGSFRNTSLYVVFSKSPSGLSTSNFTVSSDEGVTNHEGTISVTGNVASFIPTANFAANTTYKITVTGGGLASPFTSTFATSDLIDNTAPTISNTNPATGDTEVLINSTITATFSESIAPNSFDESSFTITGGMTGTVTLTDQTLSFKPNGLFTSNTIFAATIKTGLKDLAGNALAAPYSWTFTTGSTVGADCMYDTSIFNTCFFGN